METSNTEKYFLFGLLAIVLVLTLAILYPFLSVFILAAAFAVIINPVYLWIKKHITRKNSGLASLLTIILFLITLCIPLFFMGVTIFNQAQNAYYSVVTNGDTSLFIQKVDTSINNFLPDGFTFNTHEKVTAFTSFLSNNIGNFFASTFNTLLMIVITIFTMFYILKDGEEWRDTLIKIIPLSEKNIKEILSDLKNSVNRILKGSFFIAIVQGALSWLGLWFFGVPNPALWGVVAGLASFIPNLGTSIVSVPAIIFLFLNGMQIEALGLLLWSAAIVGTIDNFLSPYVISKGTEIPPLFVLFSILGGISLMGPLGILLGPLILSLLYSLVSIYRKEII
jgi:predicted PurR-regulated permease PerM